MVGEKSMKADLENRKIAQEIMNNGMFFIPLLPNTKKNNDTDILTKKYSVEEVLPNYNVGINTGLSNVYVIDLDSEYGIYFGNLWLPQDTRKHIRVYPDGRKEVVHYLFKSDGSVDKNNPLGKSASEHVELFINHNVVA